VSGIKRLGSDEVIHLANREWTAILEFVGARPHHEGYAKTVGRKF